MKAVNNVARLFSQQARQHPSQLIYGFCHMQPLAFKAVVAIVDALQAGGFSVAFHVLDTHKEKYYKFPTGKIDIAISVSSLVSCLCQQSVA